MSLLALAPSPRALHGGGELLRVYDKSSASGHTFAVCSGPRARDLQFPLFSPVNRRGEKRTSENESVKQ
jgi:hypothetical protein